MIFFKKKYRYKIVQSCWDKGPELRPHFTELVGTISALLSNMAGYLSFDRTDSTIGTSNDHEDTRRYFGVSNALAETEQQHFGAPKELVHQDAMTDNGLDNGTGLYKSLCD